MHEHGTTGIRDAFETVSAAVFRRLSTERGVSNPESMFNGSSLGDVANGSVLGSALQSSEPTLTGPEDPTLPVMDFSWLLDPSRPASPAAPSEGPADSLLDSFLLHPFVGLDQILT